MSASKPRRPRSPDRIGRIVSPIPRFTAVLIALPAFLLLDHLAAKAGLAALFAVMALLAGKRIRWGYFVILAFSIMFFHLLAPWGRVLAEIGPLTVTAGALENGAVRALTLMGMVFLSVAAVRPELRLPGRFGGLLGRTFYHFEILIDGKAGLSWKTFFSDLDHLLMERFDPQQEDFGHPAVEPAGGVKESGRGWLPAVLFALVPWAIFLLTSDGLPWTV